MLWSAGETFRMIAQMKKNKVQIYKRLTPSLGPVITARGEGSIADPSLKILPVRSCPPVAATEADLANDMLRLVCNRIKIRKCLTPQDLLSK